MSQAQAQSSKNSAEFEIGVKAYETGDYAGALGIWLPLAYENDPAAQRNVGHLYRLGLSVKQDFSKAAEWYRRAADSGLARAQANLANMYLRGQGLDEDPIEAAQWFERAAKQGHIVSQYNLGLLYENGLGRESDDAEAVKWYYLASKGGHVKALSKLALLVSKNAPPELASMLSGQGGLARTKSADPAGTPAIDPAKENPAPLQSVVAAGPPVAVSAAAPPAVRSSGDSGPSRDAATSFLGSIRTFFTTVGNGGATGGRETATAALPRADAESQVQTAAPATQPASTERSVEPEAITAAIVANDDQTNVGSAAKAVPAVPPAAILDAGLIAYRARDYRTAIANWLPLADGGNLHAEFFIGGLYADGAGVPRDVVRAHVWWARASSRGHDKAEVFLETLKLEMEPEQIVAASHFARNVGVKRP